MSERSVPPSHRLTSCPLGRPARRRPAASPTPPGNTTADATRCAHKPPTTSPVRLLAISSTNPQGTAGYSASQLVEPPLFLDAAAATAARPSGLATELPGTSAVATPASQLRDTNISVVALPPLFSGGSTVRFCVRVTRQSGQAFWSPTVDSTTGVMPAPLNA